MEFIDFLLKRKAYVVFTEVLKCKALFFQWSYWNKLFNSRKDKEKNNETEWVHKVIDKSYLKYSHEKSNDYIPKNPTKLYMKLGK